VEVRFLEQLKEGPLAHDIQDIMSHLDRPTLHRAQGDELLRHDRSERPDVRLINAPDTNRWIRLVLPTPSSPTRQILNLKVFDLDPSWAVADGRPRYPAGVIKPSARFSESGTHRLESFDVGDRPRPPVPRLESHCTDTRAGLLRRDEEAMK